MLVVFLRPVLFLSGAGVDEDRPPESFGLIWATVRRFFLCIRSPLDGRFSDCAQNSVGNLRDLLYAFLVKRIWHTTTRGKSRNLDKNRVSQTPKYDELTLT